MSFFWVNFSWPRLTEFSSSDFLNRVEQNILPFKQTHTHQLYLSSLLFPFLFLVMEILPRHCFVYDATECASLPASERCWRHTTGREESHPQPSGKPRVRSLAVVLKNARFSFRRDGRSVIFSPSSECSFPREFLQVLSYLYQHAIPSQHNSSKDLFFASHFLHLLPHSIEGFFLHQLRFRVERASKKCPQWQCNQQGAPGGSALLLPPRVNIS